MDSILCPYCGKENDSRNYYCSYCGNQVKDFHKSKKFGKRNKHFFDLKCVVEDSEPVVHVNGFTPYNSKVKEKVSKERNRK